MAAVDPRDKFEVGGACCVDWLPDELLDLVLNGTDGSGTAFFDPLERVLARMVCQRWRHVIECPSTQWTEGHLERSWCRLRFQFSKKSAPAGRTAFMSGRMATVTGGILFVHGPHPHCLVAQSAATDAQRDSSTLAVKERLQAYVHVVGAHMMEAEYRTTCRVAPLCLLLIGETGLKDIAKCALETAQIAPHFLARMGHLSEAVRLFGTINTRPNNLQAIDFICAVARYSGPHDGVVPFLAALNVCTQCPTRWCYSYDGRRIVAKLWRALALSGSFERTRALVSLVDGTASESLVHLVRVDAMTLAPHASPFLDCANLVSLLHRMASRWLNERRPDRAPQHWTRSAVEGLDCLAVLHAHGARRDDIADALFEAASMERYHLIGRILAFAGSVASWNPLSVKDDNEIAARLICTASAPTRLCACIAAHGFTLTAEQRDLIGRRLMPYEKTIDVFDAIAVTWPDTLVETPGAVANVFRWMIQHGHWDRVARLIDHLAPFFRDRIAVFTQAEAQRQTETRPETGTDARLVEGARTPSVWSMIADDSADASGEPRRYNPWDDVNAAPVSQTSRLLILARLADLCSPRSNPHTATAWRYWCGPPAPLAPGVVESAVFVLVQHDLYSLPRSALLPPCAF